MPNGLFSVVTKCPLAIANVLAREGTVALGWARVKVELLDKRPLQCYKCLELGHTRATCRNPADRSGVCYRCGESGHSVRNCLAPASCAVCRDRGLPHNHKVGGPACKGSRANTRKGRAERAGEKEKRKEQGDTPKATVMPETVPKGNKAPTSKPLGVPATKGKAKAMPQKTGEYVAKGFAIDADTDNRRRLSLGVVLDNPQSEPERGDTLMDVEEYPPLQQRDRGWGYRNRRKEDPGKEKMGMPEAKVDPTPPEKRKGEEDEKMEVETEAEAEEKENGDLDKEPEDPKEGTAGVTSLLDEKTEEEGRGETAAGCTG